MVKRIYAALAASAVCSTIVAGPLPPASARTVADAVLLPPPDGYDNTAVTDLNDHGVVVGYATWPHSLSQARALRWDLAGRVTDLGGLGGTFGSAQAVNGRDEIVGWSALAGDRATHAVRWDPQGRLHDLGVLPGDNDSNALAVNDDGTAVGTSAGPGGSYAVRWDRSGRITKLEVPPGAGMTWPVAINGRGETVGESVDSLGYAHAVRWDRQGRVTPLANRGGYRDEVYGVADDGTAAGVLFSNTERQLAVRWDRAGRLSLLAPDEDGSVAAIAANGVIAGGTATGQKLWTGDRTVTLRSLTGGLDAFVRGLNDHGIAVGSAHDPSSMGEIAVRWTSAGNPVKLPLPAGHTQTAAVKIDNRGVVVGAVTDSLPARGVVWPRG